MIHHFLSLIKVSTLSLVKAAQKNLSLALSQSLQYKMFHFQSNTLSFETFEKMYRFKRLV